MEKDRCSGHHFPINSYAAGGYFDQYQMMQKKTEND